MQAQQFNIATFNPNTVYSDITTFLNDESFSPRTKTEYLHDIKLFFSFMSKPDLPYLTHDHLHIENSDVLRFRNFLIKDKKMKPTTVNRKIASLQSLYAYFRANKYETKYNIDTNVFKVKRLKGKSNSYGTISPEELNAMLHHVTKQVKGCEKKMFLLMASRTSIREAALLALTWDDITYNQDHDCYIVRAIDKGEKERNQPISKQLYNDLIKLKELEYYKKNEYKTIFSLSTNTLCAMMKTLCEEIGIFESRHVTVHSLRNYAANFIIESGGSLIDAQSQLGHSNIQTTYNHYIEKKRNYSQSAGIILDQNIPDDILDNLTQEELLKLIKNKSDIFNRLKQEAFKLQNQRETANQ